MTIDRRRFVQGALTLGAAGFVFEARAENEAKDATFAPKPGAWRNFEITTALEIAAGPGGAQAWIPVPAFAGDGWMKPGETTWTSAAGKAARVEDPKSGAAMLHVKWEQGPNARTIEVVSRISTRDRAVDLSRGGAPALAAAERRLYTAPTTLLPVDGIVKSTADKIAAGATTDLDKARRIYEWIVDNTFRNPSTRGCGVGDIASMLETNNLGGKCADLNALYVGLARAAGLPARDIYGLRVAKSNFGYKSLGANSPTVTKAQHCRAEVFIDGLGWVPVDPADVRKVVLEEPPGKLALGDAKAAAARKALFGSWETNWLAYNDCHDVALPGSSGPAVGYLMYPQGETAEGRLDSLDPDRFKYTITAREIGA